MVYVFGHNSPRANQEFGGQVKYSPVVNKQILVLTCPMALSNEKNVFAKKKLFWGDLDITVMQI
jgi:hypothetical protein